jgi:hypothetical protein
VLFFDKKARFWANFGYCDFAGGNPGKKIFKEI